MCTALTLRTIEGNHLFGRNMDLDYNFKQSVILVPRGFEYTHIATGEAVKSKYAILGMGTIMDKHPMFAEAFNEKGLACAGLNFEGYAAWEKDLAEDKINIAPSDFILWVVSNFESIEQLRPVLADVCIVEKSLNENIPIPTLHWMVTDKEGECLVIEKTEEGLRVFTNHVGVLTNSPTFDWHITNLSRYLGLSTHQPKEINWGDEQLKLLGVGAGAQGLPGDYLSTSRFVKAAFLRNNAALGNDEHSGIVEFFRILNNVSMVRGSVMTNHQNYDITQYTSCMCLEKGVYYYTTYNNLQINAIDMNKEDLDSTEIKVFPYRDALAIRYEN
ncbi:choloylglycine hydrolase [Pradoshia eiseniae]|uniref:choloylglycine hydrolase n=1 Tax=Pradoshia eiseniae TaxID=2064768 RepID=A0A2S7MW92_9BACI|nr:choloylglycine hydrolase [Pradoshia eiseniae]PQD94043.1 choloylglycine hydrolase [Pradoshia eiseniae]